MSINEDEFEKEEKQTGNSDNIWTLDMAKIIATHLSRQYIVSSNFVAPHVISEILLTSVPWSAELPEYLFLGRINFQTNNTQGEVLKLYNILLHLP